MRTEVSTAVSVNHKELRELIKHYYKAKKSLFIWGTTGIGKSREIRETAKDIAKELGLEYSENIKDINNTKKFLVLDIRLSQMDPSDLRGIPVFDNEAKVTRWLPPESFPKKGYGIIFFDEMNLAPPLVQASAYQLILDRRLGTYVVPEGYMMIAAGNRLEDRANVFAMAAPLKNRFGHCQLEIPTVEEWTDWAVKHGIDIRIIGYLNWKRASLFTFDPKLKENAFATPRSWEACSDLIKDIPSSDLTRLQLLAATQVGVGVAGELATFIRIKDKLKPMKYYLDNPEKCELPDPTTELDVLWALVTSIAEYYRDHKDMKTLGKILKLLKRLTEEFAVFTLKLMVSVDPSLNAKIIKMPDAYDLANKLMDFLE